MSRIQGPYQLKKGEKVLKMIESLTDVEDVRQITSLMV